MTTVRICFYLDRESCEPHIDGHGVTEGEVETVPAKRDEDRLGRDGSRVAIGRSEVGRTLRSSTCPTRSPSSSA